MIKAISAYTLKLIVATSALGIATLLPGVANAQAPPASAPSPTRLFTADPRAQVRNYHLTGANIDVPYCVFASSKVSKNKAAPLIVSLHGFGAGPQIMCNKTAIDFAEERGYVLVAPMGYSIAGWYGSPVIHMGARRAPPSSAPGAASAPPPPPTLEASSAPGPSDQDIEKWSEADVMNVLAMTRKEFNVDPKRIYLTGHSMGGAGTLFLASKHANLWAAVAPVAPASFMMNGTREHILRGIKDGKLPILIVQGDADRVVAASNTRLWVETMKQLGMDYKYVELPGIDHGPVIAASQQAVYDFFDAHTKK